MPTGDPKLFSKCPCCGYPDGQVFEAIPLDRGAPHRCPVCNGSGNLPPEPCSTSIYGSTCPACNGERVLWSRG